VLALRSLLILIAAYLLGSIPFGYLLVRAKEGADVRETGSGGTGATNVSRRAGKSAGLITLLLDALKGAVAVFLAKAILTPDFGINWWVASVSVVSIIGHIFPVWLGFRGGKGVATGVGVFLSIAPLAVVCAGLIFVLIIVVTRYVSLSSIGAVIAFPICVWLLSTFVKPVPHLREVLGAAIIGGSLIIVMHHENIHRLVQGTENRFH
jgi:glycerol-3-phosphate acyltransferase PlsY